jgi:uncharacterized protein
MPFVLHALDYADALPRRMEVREKHLAQNAEFIKAGKLLYAAALMNEKGEMAGSLMVLDFTRAEIDAWLKTEPYVQNRVWEKITVNDCKVAAGF